MDNRLWFLNAAAELRLDLDVLASPQIEAALNRRTHGLSEEELVRILGDLQERGWISFSLRVADVAIAGTDEIRCALHAREAGRPRLWYGLTQAGGAEWERHARPRWGRFIDSSTGGCDEHGLIASETFAMTRLRILRFEQLCNPVIGHEPIAGTQTWEDLAPWRATYWKTLPRGTCLREQARIVKRLPKCCSRAEFENWQVKRRRLEEFTRWHDLE